MKRIIKHWMTLPATGPLLGLLDQAIASGGNFLLGILLAAQLGLKAFGQYSVWWLGVLFALGLHQALITQPMMSLHASKKKLSYLYRVSAMQGIVMAGFIAVAIALAFFTQKVELPLVVLLCAAFLQQDFLRKLCFVRKDFRRALVIDVALYSALLGGLLSYHWFFGPLTLTVSMVIIVGAYLFSIAVYLLPFRDKIRIPTAADLFITVKEHYQFSSWLLGAAVLQWFSGNFFLVAGAGVLGTQAVGALRMAQNVVGLCHVLFLYMENSVPAEAARLYAQYGKKRLLRYLQRVTLRLGLLVATLLVGLYALSPWLIQWVFGREYHEYHYLIGAYAFLYALVFLTYPMRFFLRTLQSTFPIFLAYTMSAGISMLVAFPLVRSWGMSGVLAGLIGSQLITIAIYTLFLWSNQSRPSPFWKMR